MKKIYWNFKELGFKKYFDKLSTQYFFRNYQYTKPYFLDSDLKNYLHKFISKKSIDSFLEIGSFEGLASVWINKKFLKKNGKHFIVDPLTDVLDTTTDVDMVVEENFYFNLKKFISKNVSFLKTTSDNFFSDNTLQFDFIYIDGSHLLDDIKNDLENSHQYIKHNGIIWCDDYLGGDYPELCKIPIDEFYEKYKDEYDLIFQGYQIAFKKKSFND